MDILLSSTTGTEKIYTQAYLYQTNVYHDKTSKWISCILKSHTGTFNKWILLKDGKKIWKNANNNLKCKWVAKILTAAQWYHSYSHSPIL